MSSNTAPASTADFTDAADSSALPVDIQDTIQRLKAHQDRLGMQLTAFARRKLALSPATWSRIRSGDYPLKGGSMVVNRLSSVLSLMDGDVEFGRPDAGAVTTIPTATLTTVLNAVKAANSEPRNRLVVLLAPTGAGKSWTLRTVIETYPEKAFAVEATEAWRGSYFAALRSIGMAVGVSETNLGGVKAAEEAVIAHLNRERPIICIDEAHYLGPRTLNLVKLILNQTPCVVVMAAIPTLWDMMQRGNSLEADQVRNRTYALLRQNKVIPADVANLLRARLHGIETMADWREVVVRVTEAANRFGLLNTVDRIAKALRDESPDGRYTREHVATAITVADALSQ